MGKMIYPVGEMAQIAQQIQIDASQYTNEAIGRCQSMLSTVSALPGPMQGRLDELLSVLQQKVQSVAQLEQAIGATLQSASAQAATTEATNTHGFTSGA